LRWQFGCTISLMRSIFSSAKMNSAGWVLASASLLVADDSPGSPAELA
jgi:hypothetical protein